MLRLKTLTKRTETSGFTIVELLVVMVFVVIISTAAYPFLNNTFNQYLLLQEDSMVAGDLAVQSQRIAKVLRGGTDVTLASADEVTLYAYFAPSDLYVSIIRYYKTDSNTKLKADVTPMTSNPPIGTPITASLQTYTIIGNFYNVSGVSTFEYLDSAGGNLTLPITDLSTVKGMRINLAVPNKNSTGSGKSSTSVQVSLRNKKTNL